MNAPPEQECFRKSRNIQEVLVFLERGREERERNSNREEKSRAMINTARLAIIIVFQCLILCTWVASRCVDRDAATSAAPGPGAWVVYRAPVAVLVGCWQCGDGPRNMPGLQQAGSGMCLQGLATGWQDRVADQGHGGTAPVRVQEENDWYCSIDGSCLIQL